MIGTQGIDRSNEFQHQGDLDGIERLRLLKRNQVFRNFGHPVLVGNICPEKAIKSATFHLVELPGIFRGGKLAAVKGEFSPGAKPELRGEEPGVTDTGATAGLDGISDIAPGKIRIELVTQLGYSAEGVDGEFVLGKLRKSSHGKHCQKAQDEQFFHICLN